MAYSRSNLITRGIFHTTWSLEQPQSLLTGQVLKDYETVSQKLWFINVTLVAYFYYLKRQLRTPILWI